MTGSIVEDALAHWGMSDARVSLAAQRENLVFRIESDAGQFALRVHRMGYRSEDELVSELQWMEHLASQGLLVPTPVRDKSGQMLRTVFERKVGLLTWLEGTPPGEYDDLAMQDPIGFVRQLGTEMARLHDITDAWAPPKGFTRPAWGREELVGSAPLWGRFWEHADLSPEDRRTLLRARDCAEQDLMDREDDLDRGLIHADLLTENILIREDGIAFLDFDDSAFGYRSFELATFLLRYEQRPDFDDLTQALLNGYSIRKRIESDELLLFLSLRALTYVGWIQQRMHEPGGQERSARMIDRALRLSQKYLERRDR